MLMIKTEVLGRDDDNATLEVEYYDEVVTFYLNTKEVFSMDYTGNWDVLVGALKVIKEIRG